LHPRLICIGLFLGDQPWLTAAAQAQTGIPVISENITTEYHLDAGWQPVDSWRNISIQHGATLTVEAGVLVRFSGGTGLTVHGGLRAVGRRATHQLHHANASPAPGQWVAYPYNPIRRCQLHPGVRHPLLRR